MKVYVAGPMRGIPEWNFPAFDRAEEKWRAAGHQVFSPAQIDRAMKHEPTDGEFTKDQRKHMIAVDVACIMAADAIALLPGWESSRGVTVELALAQFLGLKIFCAESMERIYPQPGPWGELKTAQGAPGALTK